VLSDVCEIKEYDVIWFVAWRKMFVKMCALVAKRLNCLMRFIHVVFLFSEVFRFPDIFDSAFFLFLGIFWFLSCGC